MGHHLNTVRGPSAACCLVLMMIGVLGGCANPDTHRTDPAVDRLVQRANAALRSGSYHQARVLADSIEAVNPGAADALFLRGRIHFDLNQWDDARRLFQQVIDHDPDYPGAWHNLANVFYRERQFRAAIDGYLMAARQSDASRSWHAAAVSLSEMGKADSALWAVDLAVQSDPTNADALRTRSTLRMEQGNENGALEDARKAYRLKPSDLDALLTWARMETGFGRPDSVLMPLRQRATELPWNYSLPFELGRAFQRLEQEELAAQWFGQSDRIREALQPTELLERRVASQPGDLALRMELAETYRDQRRAADAAEQYAAASALIPDNLDIAAMHGAALAQSGRPEAAMERFRLILTRDPGHQTSLVNLTILLLETQRIEDARRVLDQLEKANPDHPSIAALRPYVEPSGAPQE